LSEYIHIKNFPAEAAEWMWRQVSSHHLQQLRADDQANKALQTGRPVPVPMNMRRRFLRTMGVGGVDGELGCSGTLLRTMGVGVGVFSPVFLSSLSTATADEANKAPQTGLPAVVPMNMRRRRWHFLRIMGVGGVDGELGCSGNLLGARDKVEKSPCKLDCFLPTLWVGDLSVELISSIEIFELEEAQTRT
jgi:hypothetical protein